MGCSQSTTSTAQQHQRKTYSQEGGTNANMDAVVEEGVPVAVVESPVRDYKKDYRVLKRVVGAGGGGVSKIYLVQPNTIYNGNSTDVFVLQVIDLGTVARERRSVMRKELISLLDVQHPNILDVVDVYDYAQKNNTMVLVTELCSGGDLQFPQPCGELRARELVRQILQAISYMHSRGMHDHALSTSTIMLKDDTPQAKPKITYAGLASTSNFNHSVAHFLSPKANACDEDVYATGMIAYELLSGGKQPPIDMDDFEMNSEENVHYEAQVIELSAHGLCWDSYSKHARDFVHKCLRQEPHEAFTVDKALQHPWIGVKTAKAIPNPPVSSRRVLLTDEGLPVEDDDALSNERNCDSPVSLSHEDYVHGVVPSFDGDDEKKEEEGLVEILDSSFDDTNASSSRQSIPLVSHEKQFHDNSSPKREKKHNLEPSPAKTDATELMTSLDTETPDEFLDLKTVFDEVESVKSGQVTVADLKASLRRKYTEEEVNSWFNHSKFENRETVAYREILASAIASRRRIELTRVEDAFNKIDNGRQGFVTVGNLRAVLGTNNSELIEKMIKEVNKNGKITHDKFIEVLNSYNGQLDAIQ